VGYKNYQKMVGEKTASLVNGGIEAEKHHQFNTSEGKIRREKLQFFFRVSSSNRQYSKLIQQIRYRHVEMSLDVQFTSIKFPSDLQTFLNPCVFLVLCFLVCTSFFGFWKISLGKNF